MKKTKISKSLENLVGKLGLELIHHEDTWVPLISVGKKVQIPGTLNLYWGPKGDLVVLTLVEGYPLIHAANVNDGKIDLVTAIKQAYGGPYQAAPQQWDNYPTGHMNAP